LGAPRSRQRNQRLGAAAAQLGARRLRRAPGAGREAAAQARQGGRQARRARRRARLRRARRRRAAGGICRGRRRREGAPHKCIYIFNYYVAGRAGRVATRLADVVQCWRRAMAPSASPLLLLRGLGSGARWRWGGRTPLTLSKSDVQQRARAWRRAPAAAPSAGGLAHRSQAAQAWLSNPIPSKRYPTQPKRWIASPAPAARAGVRAHGAVQPGARAAHGGALRAARRAAGLRPAALPGRVGHAAQRPAGRARPRAPA